MSAHAVSARKPAHRKLARWQAWTVAGLIVLIAVGLAAYAAAASYESVSHAAASHGVPLPRLTPLGLEGGLFGVIVIEVVLVWIKHPLWWLRVAARVFAVAVIVANAAAGWPDPISMGLRVAAPFLFVVLVEVARSVLLRRNRDDDGTRFTFTRWLLAPRQTFTIWKRHKLWQDAQLPQHAIDAELAIVRLSAKYGRQWWKKAPADLVFMIRAGVHMDEALKQVKELTDPPVQREVHGSGSGVNKKRGSGRKPTRTSAVTKRSPSPMNSAVPEDVDTQAEALRILADEPDISGGELGRRLGKSESYGCRLKKSLAGSVAGPEASRRTGT